MKIGCNCLYREMSLPKLTSLQVFFKLWRKAYYCLFFLKPARSSQICSIIPENHGAENVIPPSACNRYESKHTWRIRMIFPHARKEDRDLITKCILGLPFRICLSGKQNPSWTAFQVQKVTFCCASSSDSQTEIINFITFQINPNIEV